MAVAALAGCGGGSSPPSTAAQAPATASPSTPSRPTPPTRSAKVRSPQERALLELLVPEGVPTRADGQPARTADVAVVQRWLAALTHGDIQAAADTFRDGARVQNFQRPKRLRDRAARIAFNEQFPCGAELATASTVRGYLVVTYRLTNRTDSPCDGPGGTAAGTIKVTGSRMTEWYRLPDPPKAAADDAPSPAVLRPRPSGPGSPTSA